jgi:hypothetical protein
MADDLYKKACIIINNDEFTLSNITMTTDFLVL